MKRRILGLFIGLTLLLPAIAVPELTASARTIKFSESGVAWVVKVTVCQNGFTVEATGGTVAGVIMEVHVDAVNKVVRDRTLYYYFHSVPVAFTSPSGNNLVGSATSPEFPIVAKSTFYFQESQAPNTNIQTVVSGSANGVEFQIPGAVGSDLVMRCIIPSAPPRTSDLSGVYYPEAVWRGDYAKDGRASPRAGDKVAIYCVNEGLSAGTIVVFGVDRNLKPFRLGEFKLNDLAQASPRAISKVAEDGHSIVLMQDGGQTYHFEWSGGPWSPREIKDFTCNWYGKNRYNKTPSQLKYPDAFGSDGRVAPEPTDRMVVYCNVGPRTIVVMGVNEWSQGYDLATFQYANLQAVSPNPILVDTKQYGKVALRVDNDDNFYLEWLDGPWSSYEAKGFKCRF